MKCRALLCLLPCLVLFGPGFANEIVVIEAPSLVGLMTNLDGLTGVVELPGIDGTVLGATLELSGTAHGGTLHCPDGSTVPWWVFPGAQFGNDCIDLIPGVFDAEFDAVEGTITVQAPVLWTSAQGHGAPWNCWNGTALTVALACVWGLPTNGCTPDPAPDFEITGARLILEVQPPVSTAAVSWGAVKAVYR